MPGNERSGGKRAGAGRKPLPRADRVVGMHVAAELIAKLNVKKSSKRPDSVEVAGWRDLWEAQDLRIRLDTRKYLYDKRDGKATQPVNHGVTGVVAVKIETNVKMPNPHE
jgi:hypothetical protein